MFYMKTRWGGFLAYTISGKMEEGVKNEKMGHILWVHFFGTTSISKELYLDYSYSFRL